mmetsp:Transcript_11810/g.49495  ORF Transcript_11810/g.49495 Transcript_11810/m.49495 type:complete len:280 (-) Transcript_11810:113-952(-)
MGIYRDANDANDARRAETRGDANDDFLTTRGQTTLVLYSAHPSRRFYCEYDTRRERSILPRDVYDRLPFKPAICRRAPEGHHMSAPALASSGAATPSLSSATSMASLCCLARFAAASFRRLDACVSASRVLAIVTASSSETVSRDSGLSLSVVFVRERLSETLPVGVSSNVSGAGGVNPRSRNADNNARFRSVSRASAASTDAATRSLASSRSRVSSRPILSKQFVSSLAIFFRRLITSATLERSYPALEVLSTFRSPDSFLASAFFCLRPIAQSRPSP